MAITAADLKSYCALSRPNDDSSVGGGAIDVTMRLLNSIILGNARVRFLSSSASDVSTAVIRGKGLGGQSLIEEIVLNGTTAIKGKLPFDTVTEIRLSSAAIGSIAVRNDETSALFHTIAVGEKGAGSLFKYATAGYVDGAIRYDKLFIKNTHATDSISLGSVVLTENEETVYEIGVDLSINGSLSISDRLTAPTGITFYNDSITVNFPATLTHGQAIGVWVKQTLVFRGLPEDNTVILTVNGMS